MYVVVLTLPTYRHVSGFRPLPRMFKKTILAVLNAPLFVWQACAANRHSEQYELGEETFNETANPAMSEPTRNSVASIDTGEEQPYIEIENSITSPLGTTGTLSPASVYHIGARGYYEGLQDVDRDTQPVAVMSLELQPVAVYDKLRLQSVASGRRAETLVKIPDIKRATSLSTPRLSNTL